MNSKSKVQGTSGQASSDRFKSKVEFGRKRTILVCQSRRSWKGWKQTIFWAKVDDLWVRAEDPSESRQSKGMQAEDHADQSGRSSVNSHGRLLSSGSSVFDRTAGTVPLERSFEIKVAAKYVWMFNSMFQSIQCSIELKNRKLDCLLGLRDHVLVRGVHVRRVSKYGIKKDLTKVWSVRIIEKRIFRLVYFYMFIRVYHGLIFSF